MTCIHIHENRWMRVKVYANIFLSLSWTICHWYNICLCHHRLVLLVLHKNNNARTSKNNFSHRLDKAILPKLYVLAEWTGSNFLFNAAFIVNVFFFYYYLFLRYITASPAFSFTSISPIYILCLTLSSKGEHYGPHRPKICSQILWMLRKEALCLRVP